MRSAAQGDRDGNPAGAQRGGSASRRRLLVAGKIAISAALLGWVLTEKFDVAAAMKQIAAVPAACLYLAIAGCAASYLIATIRWRLILGALGVPLGFLDAWSISWIGMFFNQTLPSNLAGDVMRVWRVLRHGAPLGCAVSSVMIDRVAALVGLAVLVIAGLPLSRELIGSGPAWWALVGIGFCIMAGLVILLAFDRAVMPLRRVLPGRVVGAAGGLARDARAAMLSIPVGPAVVAISVANFVVLSATVWTLATAFGIAAGFVDILVLFPPVLLVSLLPISFAGWGVRELAMVTALGFVGVPDSLSVALSLAFGLASLASAVPGGVIWFFSGNRRRVV